MSEVERIAKGLTEAQRQRLVSMDEAVPSVMTANLNFERGDRVRCSNGWEGVVEDPVSASGIVYCRFDIVGQCGADPRLLKLIHRAHLIKEQDNG